MEDEWEGAHQAFQKALFDTDDIQRHDLDLDKAMDTLRIQTQGLISTFLQRAFVADLLSIASTRLDN